MKISINLFSLILVMSMLTLPYLGMAQPPDPGVDPDVPLDGGLSLLIAGGVVYGVKKVRESSKK